MTNQPHICTRCGSHVPESELYTFDGHALCLHCLEENTVLCRECGERIWWEDNAGTEDVPLCQNCYDERYTSCCDCGTLLHIANANGERMYIKHDGSLDDGLELVTHPLSLAEHLHRFPWEALCKKAAALGT